MSLRKFLASYSSLCTSSLESSLNHISKKSNSSNQQSDESSLLKSIETNVVRTKLSTCQQDQYNYILKCLIKMSSNNHKNLKIAVEGNIASGKSSIIRYLQTRFEMSATNTTASVSATATSMHGLVDDLSHDETTTSKPNLTTTEIEMSPRKAATNGAESTREKRLNINLKVLTEPVHLWRNLNGVNLLDLMYNEPTKWAYPFHSYVQLTMLQNHLEIADHGLGLNGIVPDPDEHFISIMERSLFSARYCFAENLFRKNLIKPVEYEILDRWFNFMIGNHDCHLDLIFYLRTKPETCISRLHKRGRHEETRVSLDYLKSLHELHELWLNHDVAARYASNSSSLVSSPLLDINYYKPSNVIIIDADQSIDQVYKTIEHETRNAVVTMAL